MRQNIGHGSKKSVAIQYLKGLLTEHKIAGIHSVNVNVTLIVKGIILAASVPQN